MHILIAEDDPTSHRFLKMVLEEASHEVLSCVNGSEALAALIGDDAPSLAILDWVMPKLHGPSVVSKVRETDVSFQPYIILLTAKTQGEDIVRGLEAGADDYVTKPFAREELLARIRVGERILDLRHKMQERVEELSAALEEIRTLEGLLPMCSNCKKIRDDHGVWQEVESYLMSKTEASFSHGLCPDCIHDLYPTYKKIKEGLQNEG